MALLLIKGAMRPSQPTCKLGALAPSLSFAQIGQPRTMRKAVTDHRPVTQLPDSLSPPFASFTLFAVVVLSQKPNHETREPCERWSPIASL